MTQRSETVKETIIQACIELLQEKGSSSAVSMRGIAERAGVAFSMINYHFQTKENLISIAVQRFIGTIIGAANASSGTTVLGPAFGQKEMRRYLKQAMNFVAAHPEISRISILGDLSAPRAGDNSNQIAEAVYRQLKTSAGPGLSELELRLMAHIQVAAVQVLFLRYSLFAESTGMDFFDAGQRDQLLDIVLDICTSKGGKR